MNKWKKINRRTVLRAMGLTGIAIGLPPLEVMFNDRGEYRSVAKGQAAAPPRRLFAYWWAHGAPMADFTPAQIGSGFTPSAILEGLNEIYAGDAANQVKQSYSGLSDIAVITGISNRNVQRKNVDGEIIQSHGECMITSMTGTQSDGGSDHNAKATAPSFDVMAGDLIGTGTLRRSYQMAMRVRAQPGAGRYSWKEENGSVVGIEPVTDPRLFLRIFSDVPSGPEAQAELEALHARRRSILDFAGESIQALQAKLGSEDKARLEHHLSSIREVEEAMNGYVTDCSIPTQPSQSGSLPEDGGDARARSELLIELAVMALRCDVTRVMNFSLQPSADGTTNLNFVGVSDGGATDHNFSHYSSESGERSDYVATTKWKVFAIWPACPKTSRDF
ncbi:MAG: DUF1552 domain-containing protein [Myxococcales bacterium]|nr:MAG: DUF1552 domain-containing protein [Myxococcales bacterium]